MTKTEKGIIHKWLCESLPYEPKALGNTGEVFTISPADSLISVPIMSIDCNYLIPIARPLFYLTKPIKVEGYNERKEFVPVLELHKQRYRKVGFDKCPNHWIDLEHSDEILIGRHHF